MKKKTNINKSFSKKSEIQETQKYVESLLFDDPAKTSSDIYYFIRQHRLLFLNEFGNFIKQFEDFFNDMSEFVTLLNYAPKDEWSDAKKTQYLMFPETMKTLHRAFEDINDGYYDESMMLNRSVYETFLRIVFISCYSINYESVFVRPKKGCVAFNITNFSKDILKINWDYLYRIMSAIHHSKKHKILKEITSRQNNPKQVVRLVYESDRKVGMPMCVNITMFNLTCFFHALISLFGKDIDNNENTKAKKIRWLSVDKALLMILEANPKPDFASLSRDIKKIGRIIKASGAGENWQKLV